MRDLVDDFVRLHTEQRLDQRRISADGDVVADICGIDRAGMGQQQALLIAIERNVTFVHDRFAAFRMAVQQSGNDPAPQERFVDNFDDIFGLHLLVQDLLRMDH